jgi:hypothetical protein
VVVGNNVHMTDLFKSEELRTWLEELQGRAVAEASTADKATLRFDPDAVIDRIVEQFGVEELTIDWSAMTRDDVRAIQVPSYQFGERYSVNAFTMTLYVPFEGSARLFNMRASTFTMGGTPEGRVSGNTLILEVQQSSADPDALQASIDQLKSSLETYVGWGNTDVQRWRTGLASAVQAAVTSRKANLDEAASLSDSLTIPLKQTQGTGVSIPVARKTVRATDSRPRTATVDTPNDPALSETIYEDVLKTLRAVGNSFERLPKTAARFDEEELRDVLLFILNSNYEGAASGEVFNGAGKTDILVRHKDRNAFIGECKMWHGPKAFGEAIDQLLSYTVWRDTKAALVLFIRSGDASAIIEKADIAIRAHAEFVSERKAAEPESRRDYLMRAKDDPSRSIRVALLPIVVRGLLDE